MLPGQIGQSSHLREQDLAGKVAIITGAGRGIGRAIAKNLASRGSSILGTCTSDLSRSHIDSLREEVAGLYEGSGIQVPQIVDAVLSLSDHNAATIVADAMHRHFNSIVDIYINNAACVDRTPIGGLELAAVQTMLFGNIQTPAMIIDELVKRKYFRPKSRIIFISSAESSRCAPDALMYGTTKSANEAMARAYANALGGNVPEFTFMKDTTANSISTGLTETEGPQQFGEEVFDAFKDYWVSRQSIPRLAKPEDVADVVGLLCSRDARWITGSKVAANGGSIKIL